MRTKCSANTQNEGTVHFERGSTPCAFLVDTNELAALLCVTPRTIVNMLQKRKIPGLKVGSLNRFNVQRVLESLEKKEANDKTQNFVSKKTPKCATTKTSYNSDRETV